MADKVTLAKCAWRAALMRGLDDLQRCGAFCDVLIMDLTGNTLSAHSCVLAASSSMLRQLVSQAADPLVIKVDTIDCSVWFYILRFIYAGKVTLDAKDLPGLYLAAKHLKLNLLVKLIDKAKKKGETEGEKEVDVETDIDEEENEEEDEEDFSLSKSIIGPDDQPVKSGKDYMESLVANAQLSLPTPAALSVANGNFRNISFDALEQANLKVPNSGVTTLTTPNNPLGFSVRHQTVKKMPKRKYGLHIFTCTLCGKVFPRRSYLLTHMSTHSGGKKQYKCHYCKKEFAIKMALFQHERVHKDAKPLDCTHCDDVFTRSLELDQHMLNEHKVGKYSCTVCGDPFLTEIDMKNHLSTHSGEKPFECTQCGDRFSQQGTLNVHMRKHTGEKPFSCSFCKKRFSDHSHYSRHQRSHLGIRSFLCPLCGKTYTRRDNLNTHILKLHVEGNEEGKFGKRWFCATCHQKFNQRKTYQDHLKRHAGEKPYHCTICNKGFNSASHFNRHIKIHGEDKSYICNHCNKSFSRKDNLNTHVQKVHGEKIPEGPRKRGPKPKIKTDKIVEKPSGVNATNHAENPQPGPSNYSRTVTPPVSDSINSIVSNTMQMVASFPPSSVMPAASLPATSHDVINHRPQLSYASHNMLPLQQAQFIPPMSRGGHEMQQHAHPMSYHPLSGHHAQGPHHPGPHNMGPPHPGQHGPPPPAHMMMPYNPVSNISMEMIDNILGNTINE